MSQPSIASSPRTSPAYSATRRSLGVSSVWRQIQTLLFRPSRKHSALQEGETPFAGRKLYWKSPPPKCFKAAKGGWHKQGTLKIRVEIKNKKLEKRSGGKRQRQKYHSVVQHDGEIESVRSRPGPLRVILFPQILRFCFNRS